MQTLPSQPGAFSALLLIDVINDLDFPHANQLLAHAIPMAKAIAKLASRARAAGLPVIYVNDNFGRWRSDFRAQVDYCLSEESNGREVASLLRPQDRDYFVLKPKHSGFYSTSLDSLLDQLGVETLILCGMAGNICVLFTANDAYMRDYKLIVPRDCIASNTAQLNRYSIMQMRTVLKAETPLSSALTSKKLGSLARKSRGKRESPK
jgi:nicotinamidase-related amidase